MAILTKITNPTEHGEPRHGEIECPTSEAEPDKGAASEIYFDIESEHYIFVGEKCWLHIFTAKGTASHEFSHDEAESFGTKRNGQMRNNQSRRIARRFEVKLWKL